MVANMSITASEMGKLGAQARINASTHEQRKRWARKAGKASGKARMKKRGSKYARSGKTPEFSSWMNMHKRCYDPNHISFKYYGARGITVCERWHTSNHIGFDNFLADMGKKPTPLHTIDRIEGRLNYTPENCRWATKKEQANNKISNERSGTFVYKQPEQLKQQ